jgi:hypothetical protein
LTCWFDGEIATNWNSWSILRSLAADLSVLMMAYRRGAMYRWVVLAYAIAGLGSGTVADDLTSPGERTAVGDRAPAAVAPAPASREAKPAVPAAKARRGQPAVVSRPSRLRGWLVRRFAGVRPSDEQQAPRQPSDDRGTSAPPANVPPEPPAESELSEAAEPSGEPAPVAVENSALPEVIPSLGLTPLWLNNALHLEDSPIRIFGWIENSVNIDTNGLPRNRENFGIVPDSQSNQWMGNQYYLVMENPLEPNDMVNFGFRVDFLFGNDWQLTKQYDNAFPLNHFPGIDLPQVYAEVHLPILTPGGLDLRAGRFYTPEGFENPPAVARPLMSMSYALANTPFTFFGAVGTLHISDQVTFTGGTIDGFDRWPNKPYKWGGTGILSWTSRDGRLTLSLGGADVYDQLPRFPPANSSNVPVPQGNPAPGFLPGQVNPFYNRSGRGFISAAILYDWTDKLTHVLETDSIFDQRILGFSNTPYVPKGAAYYMFSQWLLYEFSPKVTGILRGELLWDPYGLATGSPNSLREITIGLNLQPKPWLWLRPEARYDWAQQSHPFNDGTRSSQCTIGFDVIVLF